ncbi:MAG: DUF4190 domain-containing protein [Bacilli bacterium]|nr:DUF4190 domain-containing protein [Bacilli bacterium]
MAMKNNNNVVSAISLTLGIISIIMFIFAMFDNLIGIFVSIIGLASGIVAIVLGVKGKKKKNRGMAVAGFVLGIIGVSLCSISFLGCSTSLDTDNNGNELYDNDIYETDDNYYDDDYDLEDELEKSYMNLLNTYKESCENQYKDIDYSKLSRNPDDYKYECIHFKGEVIQVLEDFDTNVAQLRVNTKLTDYEYIDNYYIDDTIYVYVYDYDSNDRILEDDIINLYGISEGILTYESVLGSSISIPSMTALSYSIE